MLKSESSRILAISLAIVLLLFMASMAIFTSGFKPTVLMEQPLSKNAQFSPQPGDAISYFYNGTNESGEISFAFGRQGQQNGNFTVTSYANCTLALLSGANSTTCIGKDGRDGESNESLASADFMFFSPWMLALSENFSWKAQVLNGITREPLENFSVAYAGREQYLGRDAFVLDVMQEGVFGSVEKRVWVDSKTRILLKEEGKNYTLEITRAWFPLRPQAE